MITKVHQNVKDLTHKSNITLGFILIGDIDMDMKGAPKPLGASSGSREQTGEAKVEKDRGRRSEGRRRGPIGILGHRMEGAAMGEERRLA